MGWRSLRASRWVWASSPNWAMGWLFTRAVALRPGWSQAGASAVKVMAAGPPGGVKRERMDSMAPLSSKKRGEWAVYRSVVVGLPVRPRESWGDSWTALMMELSAGMVPVNIWPCSKRRTSFTSRLRLWASMFNMPGISEGRRRLASSERGFSMGTVCGVSEGDGSVMLIPTLATIELSRTWGTRFGWKRSASWWEAKVLEMDAL